MWTADTDFAGGSAFTNCGGSPAPACPASLGIPFLNSRFQASTFSYNLPAAPGFYWLALGFIEPNKGAPNKRLFNVTVNGAPVLSSFDIFKTAGGTLIPYVATFPVVSMGSSIKITFTAVLSNPLVSSIELDPLSDRLPPGPAGTPGAPGAQGNAGPQGPPGPLVPIQQDDFQVFCSTQPPQNCTGQFALTFMPIGRILVLRNGTLVQRSCYTILPPSPPNNAAIQFTCTINDGDVMTLLYPAAGPASAIGNPAMLLRYSCPNMGTYPDGTKYDCTGLEAHVLIDNAGTPTVWVASPASSAVMAQYSSWPILPTVFWK